ncbi:MAG: hypothetical protein ACK587_10870 [Cyanobacteriota bacterium]|jgi:hypothetical protein
MARVQLFLSTVTAEFLTYREHLRHLLTRPNVEVKVQEDFIVTGDEPLEMLDTYIQGCDGAGSPAVPAPHVSLPGHHLHQSARFARSQRRSPGSP